MKDITTPRYGVEKSLSEIKERAHPEVETSESPE